jgi:CRP/FNR family transcriptional regulator, anaerobic regulatory protein
MIDADLLAAAMPFAGSLAPATRARLCDQVRVLSLPPRVTLLQPGDSVSGVYFVERGAIRVHYLDADGREGTLYRIGPGASCILALNCLFAEMRYPAWAEAGEEGVVFATLDGATTRSLMADDPAFMKALFEQVSSRLYNLLTTLERAIRLPLEARLIRLLLDLADEAGTVPLSQERIAGHLGTSREVASRIIRALASDKLVEAAYGKLRLIDRAALAERGT